MAGSNVDSIAMGTATLPTGTTARLSDRAGTNQQLLTFAAPVPTTGTWAMSFGGVSTSALSFNERQRIKFSTVPTGGTWTVSFNGATTTPLAATASVDRDPGCAESIIDDWRGGRKRDGH